MSPFRSRLRRLRKYSLYETPTATAHDDTSHAAAVGDVASYTHSSSTRCCGSMKSASFEPTENSLASNISGLLMNAPKRSGAGTPRTSHRSSGTTRHASRALSPSGFRQVDETMRARIRPLSRAITDERLAGTLESGRFPVSRSSSDSECSSSDDDENRLSKSW